MLGKFKCGGEEEGATGEKKKEALAHPKNMQNTVEVMRDKKCACALLLIRFVSRANCQGHNQTADQADYRPNWLPRAGEKGRIMNQERRHKGNERREGEENNFKLIYCVNFDKHRYIISYINFVIFMWPLTFIWLKGTFTTGSYKVHLCTMDVYNTVH